MRYRPRVRPRDEALKVLLPRLAREAPRQGYRRMATPVRALLGPMGRNTIQRLWQLLGLQVKPRKRKRRRRKPLPSALGLRACGVNHVWCLDFMKDWTLGGRALRLFSVVDEYTRECLELVAARRFGAADVVAVLEWLGHTRGMPTHVRSDNGPEFVAGEMATWAQAVGVQLVRSAPGRPWENAFSESFHSRARDEFTEQNVFGSPEEAQVLCESFRQWYNVTREHSSLGEATPTGFAEQARARGLVFGPMNLIETTV